MPDPGMGRGSPADQQSFLSTVAQAKACRDCGGIVVVKEQGGFHSQAVVAACDRMITHRDLCVNT